MIPSNNTLKTHETTENDLFPTNTQPSADVITVNDMMKEIGSV